jgi:hypothetical protein
MKDEALAATSGLIKGVGDMIRVPAQLANSAGNALGLRSDDEARAASQQIEDSFKLPDALEEAGAKHPTIEKVAEFIPGLVGGQAVMKTMPKAIIGAPLYTQGTHALGEVLVNPTAQRVGAAGLSAGQNAIGNEFTEKVKK